MPDLAQWPAQLTPPSHHQSAARRSTAGPGPAARTHDGQFDVSPFPEVLRAQRRHLALTHQHDWWHVETAVTDAASAICHALRDGAWITGQQQRLRQLAPGTWQQALADTLRANPAWPGHSPAHPAVEIAIYPDVIWLAARSSGRATPPAAPYADALKPPQGVMRHMDMKKQAPIVAGGLVVLSSLASCSSSTPPPAAEVTGFASAPVTSLAPSGPISVSVTGKEASLLAQLVSQLPSTPQSPMHCHEPPGLIYRIVFGGGAGSTAQPKDVVEGYRCDAGVAVTVTGKATSWRRDANCALIRAVRHVLPDQAQATQSLGIGCGS